MSRGRWALWLGPPVVLLAVAVVLSRFQASADAGGRTAPPIAGECAASPIETTAAGKPKPDIGVGSWWRMTDVLDANGAMAGRRLAAGREGATMLILELGVESAASGPVAGVVVATTDDGRQSEIRLVAPLKGCSWLVAMSRDVVRGAILDPSDGSVLAHMVSRETRDDLGTWRFSAPGALAEPVLIAPALRADAGGPVWATDLRLDRAGRILAVQSCLESGCLTRLYDLRLPARAPTVLDGDQGSLIGFAGGRVVTWAACDLLPCAIQSWDARAGGVAKVLDGAEAAAVTPDGRFLVATVDSSIGRTLRVELATGARFLVRGVAAGELAISGAGTSSSGIQLRIDEVAIGAAGAIPRSFRPSAAEIIP